MNRVIKFRGVNVVGELVYGLLVYNALDRADFKFCISRDRGLITPIRTGTESQFTGLCDKHGVEIYDGDVISAVSKPFGSVVGAVTFSQYDDRECYVHQYHLGWNVSEIPLTDLVKDGAVIVGNVHQHPELLK